MKRIAFACALALLSLLAASPFAAAQTTLPNITYNAILNSTCGVTTACSGAIIAGQGGVPALPQSNTGIMGSGSAIDIPVANYNAAVVTIQGTYAGSTINFEVSDAINLNYYPVVCARTDINLLELSEVVPTNQAREWQCPVYGSYRFRIRQSAYTSGSPILSITLSQAAIDPSLVIAASIANVAGANDPCQDLSAIKSSVPISIATNTTTELVAAVAGKTVYVCGGFLNIGVSATAEAIQFKTGTKVTNPCDTSTANLTGTYIGNTASLSSPVEILANGTSFPSISGGEICLTTATGTTVNVNGYISYVQQ